NLSSAPRAWSWAGHWCRPEASIPPSCTHLVLPADPQGLTVDAAGTARGEEADGLGDVDRMAALLQARQPPGDLSGQGRHLRGHIGFDEPGCHGVDRPAAGGELLRRGGREHDDT